MHRVLVVSRNPAMAMGLSSADYDVIDLRPSRFQDWVADGAAEVDLKLTEYRKPDPTPLEEFIFFDHPSTRFRIHDAMRWREAMGTP